MSVSGNTLYDTVETDDAWRNNALRTFIPANGSELDLLGINLISMPSDRRDLISMRDIILTNQNDHTDNSQEGYIMLCNVIDQVDEQERSHQDATFSVKRTKLIFNDKECIVLNFQDISAIKRLKHEQKKSKLLNTLWSSIHHEIIGPLKSNEQAAIRLIRGIQDQALREQAQIILICSK